MVCCLKPCKILCSHYLWKWEYIFGDVNRELHWRGCFQFLGSDMKMSFREAVHMVYPSKILHNKETFVTKYSKIHLLAFLQNSSGRNNCWFLHLHWIFLKQLQNTSSFPSLSRSHFFISHTNNLHNNHHIHFIYVSQQMTGQDCT